MKQSSNIVKTIICGDPTSFSQISFSIPCHNQLVFNSNEIESLVNNKEADNIVFIVLLINFDHQQSNEILNKLLSHRKVLKILLCENVQKNASIKHDKIVYVNRQSICNQVILQLIDVYELLAEQSPSENQSFISRKQIKRLKKLYDINLEIFRSHIFIYPVNTDYWNTVDFQTNLIEKLKKLYPKREIIVSTLFDYISYDKNKFSKFTLDMGQLICQVLNKMQWPMIKIGLLGNEDPVYEGWCSEILGSEMYQYDPFPLWKSILMENEPITNETKTKVQSSLQQWNRKDIEPRRIDNIMGNRDFGQAIQIVAEEYIESKGKQTVNIKSHNQELKSGQCKSICSEMMSLAIVQASAELSSGDSSSDDDIDAQIQK